MLLCNCILSICIKHKKKKHKKKLKKRKCREYINDSVDCYDQLTDYINLSAVVDASDLHKHETVFNATETFVNSLSDLQDKKSHKRKRTHSQEDVIDQQKPNKYPKIKCDNVRSLDTSVPKEHCSKSSSDMHTSSEKLSKQLCTDMLPEVQCIVDGQQQKKHKKKKKTKLYESATDSHETSYDAYCKQLHKHKKKKTKLYESATDSHETSYDAYCKQLHKHKKKKTKLYESATDSHETSYDAYCTQLHKHKKKKKHKKTKHKEVVPQSNFSKDFPQHCSPRLLVSNEVSGTETVSRDAAVSTSKYGHVLLVNELEDIGSEEMKYVEQIYEEHKSRNSKHKRLKVNTGMETEIAVSCPIVVTAASPNVCSGIHSHSPAKLNKEHKSHKRKQKPLKVNTEMETEIAVSCPVVSETSPNVCSELHNCSPTEKSASEQCMSNANVLKLLHGENSLYYLHRKSDVEEAGGKL